MRIRSTSRIEIEFRLPVRLRPSTEDSFLVAEFDQFQRGWAFTDSAISVCAQAMADNKSVDDVLAQIRNHIDFLWNVNPALPFELLPDEPEKDSEA
ncbi:hypothetical protein AB0N24_00930 [Arthrobacter sp. NPDC093128]|uniref:hypothetical protein n=1 Tax=Arthrobacter sp. NPDC093128 TaxID=3154979 RepID=UPI00344030C2